MVGDRLDLVSQPVVLACDPLPASLDIQPPRCATGGEVATEKSRGLEPEQQLAQQIDQQQVQDITFDPELRRPIRPQRLRVIHNQGGQSACRLGKQLLQATGGDPQPDVGGVVERFKHGEDLIP